MTQPISVLLQPFLDARENPFAELLAKQTNRALPADKLGRCPPVDQVSAGGGDSMLARAREWPSQSGHRSSSRRAKQWRRHLGHFERLDSRPARKVERAGQPALRLASGECVPPRPDRPTGCARQARRPAVGWERELRNANLRSLAGLRVGVSGQASNFGTNSGATVEMLAEVERKHLLRAHTNTRPLLFVATK